MSNRRSNVLHDYANYTYNLQLWAITANSFNQIGKGNISAERPGGESAILTGGELLIANGGAGKLSRSPSFPVDFAIDNLEIESIIGNRGPQARGIDALRIKFDIFEPYTVTLFNRLTNVVLRQSMGPDFKTLIYCLVIEFLGYNDKGEIKKVEGVTKYIPFTMLNMQLKITSKGAVYSCEGIPVQNLLLTMIDNQVPFHLELQGTTVKDIFNAKATPKRGASSAARSDRVTQPYNNNTTLTKGIAEALNENEKFRVLSKAQLAPNVYAFEFDEEIGNSKIADPKTISDKSVSMSVLKGSQGQQTAQSGRVGALTLDNTAGTIRAQAGTRITDLIGSVLTVSEYMKNVENYSKIRNYKV